MKELKIGISGKGLIYHNFDVLYLLDYTRHQREVTHTAFSNLTKVISHGLV